MGPLVNPSTTINSLYRRAIHIRRGSRLSVYNSLFAGWPVGLDIMTDRKAIHLFRQQQMNCRSKLCCGRHDNQFQHRLYDRC
jgi:hypothetical protein